MVATNVRFIEGRIISHLLSQLTKAGWQPDAILLDEGWEPTTTKKAVKELVDDLDDAHVRFRNADGKSHTVYLVRGNGVDIISDWTFTDGDADGFSAVMDQITDHVIETYDR